MSEYLLAAAIVISSMLWGFCVGIFIQRRKHQNDHKTIGTLNRLLTQRDLTNEKLNRENAQLQHDIDQYKDASYEWESLANSHLEKLREVERERDDLQDQVAYLARQLKDEQAFIRGVIGDCDE